MRIINITSNTNAYVIIRNLNLKPGASGTIDVDILVLSELKSLRNLSLAGDIIISTNDFNYIVDKIASMSGGSGGGTASYPSFTGNADKVLTVNATEDDVEWTTVPSGGGVGSVNGQTGVVVLDADDVGATTQTYVDTQDNLITNSLTLKADTNYVDTQDGLLQDQINLKSDAIAVNQVLSTKADLVGGVIPASQLPSYVDDVLNFPELASFPFVGEDGKIYVAEDANKTYRWSGSSYVESGGGGVVLGETSSTAYRGDNGKIAYDHSQSQGNPHNTTTSEINEGTKLFFTEPRVRQTVLTGLDTSTASPALATDQLLTAIGKLQAQINNSNSSGFNWVNATAISGFSFRSGVGTHSPQPLKFAIKDGLLWMSGSVYANSLNTVFEIFTLTNSNYQLEQPTTTYTVTLSYFPAFYVKTGDYIESQIDFKLTKQGSTLRLLPTSSLSTSSGVFLIVFKTMCIGRLVS